MSLVEASLALKGSSETPVKVKILRDNATLEFSLERTAPPAKPVSYIRAEGTAGILKFHHLRPPCSGESRTLLNGIKPNGRPLVLDLRNCAEGEVGEAVELVNLFVEAGPVGYFEKRGGLKEIVSCTRKAEYGGLPLVTWINQATVGPAELVAGVLQEKKKIKTIGLETPGLAAREFLHPLQDGSALLLVSGVFYLDSGKKLWSNGITPDVKIELRDQTQAAFLKKTLEPLSRA
jgi:carboxyl-terminal processing protease